ncbi:helix-turn-helix transcriptional regulator [Nocardia transvalensis]|uniref:helix-turn-helix transcriptional regulator n=1 Tax=Nocardia transvalensis TaxID=37333 RepID=UPI0018939F9C|nr:helix-turn-helix transcriptional regulator [Nocardia transvalensis]MBF6329224.1 helix-turn-helix transcriptional regulator [Nocardia transvalensis]
MGEASETFGVWLNRQLARSNMSQTELAAELGVTRAAVSAWVNNRAQPREEIKRKIAEVFGLGVTSLDLRDTDVPTVLPIRWRFRPAHADGGREYGNVAAFAFNVDLSVLVREATQNSLDERFDDRRPVSVRYTLHELTGDNSAVFKDAIRWNDLAKHLDAATESGQKVARSLRAALDELHEQKSILLLRIEDYNAAGLTGDEYEDGRFAAVVRRQLDSRKELAKARAGGSYGLGKATLWATSRFGLVLMNSTLSHAHEGRTRHRLMGRIELPWHMVDGRAFAGPAWLGEPDMDPARKEVSKSWWADEDTVRSLFLERRSPEPGTSFLIVGAHDGSGRSNELTEMHSTIVRALGEQFWAAMVHGRNSEPMLRATVSTYRNGHVIIPDELVNPHAYRPALSRALQAYLNDETVTALTVKEQVVRVDVPLRVFRRKSERSSQPKEISHNAVLLLTTGEDGDGMNGKVAFMRGNRMTVMEKRPRSLPLGAIPFQAVLLAGAATGNLGPDAERAEQLLRASEPPTHDNWGRTEELTAEYESGAGKRIEEFLKSVEQTIQRLVARRATETGGGPAGLRELLRFGGSSLTNVRGVQGAPTVQIVDSHVDENGGWHVRVGVRLPDSEAQWFLTPVAKFDVSSGGRPTVEWESLTSVENCRIDRGNLVIESGIRSAEFVGVTDPLSHPVQTRYARLIVDVRHARGPLS